MTQKITLAELELLREDIDDVLLDQLCIIQRGTSSGTDGFGHPLPVTWNNHLVNLECHFWMNTEREEPNGPVVATAWMMVPSQTNITQTDRLLEVRDQTGDVISRSRNIEAILYRPSFLQVLLAGVEGA